MLNLALSYVSPLGWVSCLFVIAKEVVVGQRLAMESSELSSEFDYFCFLRTLPPLPTMVLSTPAPRSSKAAETTGSGLSSVSDGNLLS